MKKEVNPVVGGIVILLVVAAIAAWIYKGASHSNMDITDTQLPPEVAQRLKTQGPQPMPPMPGFGGASAAPGSAQNGPPVKR